MAALYRSIWFKDFRGIASKEFSFVITIIDAGEVPFVLSLLYGTVVARLFLTQGKNTQFVALALNLKTSVKADWHVSAPPLNPAPEQPATHFSMV